MFYRTRKENRIVFVMQVTVINLYTTIRLYIRERVPFRCLDFLYSYTTCKYVSVRNFIGYDNFIGWLYRLVLMEIQFCILKYFKCLGSWTIVGFHQNDKCFPGQRYAQQLMLQPHSVDLLFCIKLVKEGLVCKLLSGGVIL